MRCKQRRRQSALRRTGARVCSHSRCTHASQKSQGSQCTVAGAPSARGRCTAWHLRRRRALVGRTRKSSAESGARGAHQGQYQPRLKRMPHGLHSSAGLQRERDSGGSGRRLGRDPRCAARTRDTHPRGRPPPPNPCATWACPARASQRASQGASRGATKAAALQPSSGHEQTRRRNAATPRAFSCAVTHDGLAHFWPRGAAAAPAAGAAIELEAQTQGCSNCRRAARARARQAAALRR